MRDGDLASGTSSRSTKLIHGGLRYRRAIDFRLVREALTAREVLWRIAPQIVQPIELRAALPGRLAPAWMLRLGLFLYDHLGGRSGCPGTRGARSRHGCRRTAAAGRTSHGLRIFGLLGRRRTPRRPQRARCRRPRRRHPDGTKAVSTEHGPDGWRLVVADGPTGRKETIAARALVNAAGPWVEEVLRARVGVTARGHVRLVEGSHIVTRKLFDHDRAYIFQNSDGRVVFAIPYGTT